MDGGRFAGKDANENTTTLISPVARSSFLFSFTFPPLAFPLLILLLICPFLFSFPSSSHFILPPRGCPFLPFFFFLTFVSSWTLLSSFPFSPYLPLLFSSYSWPLFSFLSSSSPLLNLSSFPPPPMLFSLLLFLYISYSIFLLIILLFVLICVLVLLLHLLLFLPLSFILSP